MIDGNLAMASERVHQGPHDHEPASQSELIEALRVQEQAEEGVCVCPMCKHTLRKGRKVCCGIWHGLDPERMIPPHLRHP